MLIQAAGLPAPQRRDIVELNARQPSADRETHLERLRSREKELAQLEPQDRFDETPSNRDVNQTRIEQKLLSELGPKARLQFHQDISQLDGRILTRQELVREFEKLANDPRIPHEYIVDGCYARAHLMCETMRADDVNCAKMFVMVEDPYEGRLEASNKYMDAQWWYHVAPLAFATDPETNEVEAYVMDPALANRPLLAEEWVHAIWDEDDPIKLDVTRAPQYGPYETEGANRTFEESLRGARRILARYQEELKEIKEDYCRRHPEECPSQVA